MFFLCLIESRQTWTFQAVSNISRLMVSQYIQASHLPFIQARYCRIYTGALSPLYPNFYSPTYPGSSAPNISRLLISQYIQARYFPISWRIILHISRRLILHTSGEKHFYARDSILVSIPIQGGGTHCQWTRVLLHQCCCPTNFSPSHRLFQSHHSSKMHTLDWNKYGVIVVSRISV